MLLRTLPFCFAIALAVGCIPIKHPLSEVADDVRAEDFAGEWYRIDPHFGVDDEPLRIVASQSGGCDIPDGCKTNAEGTMSTKLISAAGWTFVEVRLIATSNEHVEQESSYLMSIERRGDWIAIRRFDDEAIQRFIESGNLEGEIVKGLFSNSITITAPPKAFEKFLATHREEAFEERYDLYRLKSADFPTPAQVH